MKLFLSLILIVCYAATTTDGKLPTQYKVTLTAYSNKPEFTDSTPNETAFMTGVRECTVAVSRDIEKLGFKRGEFIYIEALKHNVCRGIYQVNDRMHYRKTMQLDIFFFATKRAIIFGRVENITIVFSKYYF